MILNHVVEQMRNPVPVLADETLHLYDYPTNVSPRDVREMVNVLLANEGTIVHAGRSREGFWTSLADIFHLAKRCVINCLLMERCSGWAMCYQFDL